MVVEPEIYLGAHGQHRLPKRRIELLPELMAGYQGDFVLPGFSNQASERIAGAVSREHQPGPSLPVRVNSMLPRIVEFSPSRPLERLMITHSPFWIASRKLKVLFRWPTMSRICGSVTNDATRLRIGSRKTACNLGDNLS